jgi:exopolysaccharide biosynthesis protein
MKKVRLIKLLSLILLTIFINTYINAAETQAKVPVTNTKPVDSISYSEKTLKLSSGNKTVKIITVDPKSPEINFEVNTPGSKLNVTQDFNEQIKAKKPFAAVNANFFGAYDEIKDPIGHVMANNNLIWGQSGITSLGITKNKNFVFSVPGIFTRLFSDNKRTNTMRPDGTAYYNTWTAYEVNTRAQSDNVSILYTPARGVSINITAAGYVLTVRSETVVSFTKINPPTTVAIPQDGYITFFGNKIVNGWKGDNGLYEGRKIKLEYYLFKNTNPEFKLENMQWMLSGGPELVMNRKAAPISTNPIFTGERFTTMSTSRTAIGLTEKGQLLIISATAKISELKEIMLTLGCKDAINLDGGASTAMYYNGKTLVSPGRKLATVLFIYKKQ